MERTYVRSIVEMVEVRNCHEMDSQKWNVRTYDTLERQGKTEAAIRLSLKIETYVRTKPKRDMKRQKMFEGGRAPVRNYMAKEVGSAKFS